MRQEIGVMKYFVPPSIMGIKYLCIIKLLKIIVWGGVRAECREMDRKYTHQMDYDSDLRNYLGGFCFEKDLHLATK